MGRVYKWKWSGYVCMCVCASSLQRWSIRLFIGFRDPYNHTYSESWWWKLFKNHQKTQIQRQRQWQRQRQRQRQRHRKSAWNTQVMLYFWNPDDSLTPNMMIDTSPWWSCSRRAPWLACSSHTISSTGPSVSSFRDFFSILLVLTYFNVWYIFNIKAKTFLQNHDFPAKTTWIVIKDCGKVDVVRTSGCCCWWQLTANVTSCSDTEPPAVIHLHSWTVSNWLKFTQRKNRGVILVMKTIFKNFSSKMLWYWKFLSGNSYWEVG